MIISHKHRFIFIKTRKTAGTSIEISLSRYCDAGDIVTPITLSDEYQRGVLGLSAQNYLDPSDGSDRSVLRRPVRRALLRTSSRLALRQPGWIPWRIRKSLSNYRDAKELQRCKHFYNHMSAAEVIEHVGQAIWTGYFCFCFDRDPIDKVTSDYHYRSGNSSFAQYLERQALPIDYDKYYVDGRLAVDFVGRFEFLLQDLKEALSRVGLSYDGWLPRAKARRTSKGPLDISPGERTFVLERFRREFERAATVNS